MISKLLSQSKTDANYLSLIYGNEWWNNSDLARDTENSPTIKTLYESAIISTPQTKSNRINSDNTIVIDLKEVEAISLAKTFDEMVMHQIAKEEKSNG